MVEKYSAGKKTMGKHSRRKVAQRGWVNGKENENEKWKENGSDLTIVDGFSFSL